MQHNENILGAEVQRLEAELQRQAQEAGVELAFLHHEANVLGAQILQIQGKAHQRERELSDALRERTAYITALETELARKDAALVELTARLQQREQELIVARTPRLPWKRRAPR